MDARRFQAHQGDHQRPAESARKSIEGILGCGHAQHPRVPGDNQVKHLIATSLLLLCAAAGTHAQPVDPARFLQPLGDTWPIFNGDYSGRRYSQLKQINSGNVQSLGLVWEARAETGGGGNPFGVQIKGTPLMIDGILYVTMPDNTW